MNVARRPYDVIVFDLDGVITTEKIYWECARLTLWELLHVHWRVTPYKQAVHDVLARQAMLPDDLVYRVKNHAINSNWDLTFLGACAALGALPQGVAQGADSVAGMLAHIAPPLPSVAWPDALQRMLDAASARRGPDLLGFAGEWAAERTGVCISLFAPEGPWWRYLYDRFQGWYGGQAMATWAADPLPEYPVLPVEMLQRTLQKLVDAGYVLGTATGRPREEALYPLQSFGLLQLFAAGRMVTYTDVQDAQRVSGLSALGKPHPYAIRRALWPAAELDRLLDDGQRPTGFRALVVGDSASDALAAHAAGVPCLGVLSGVQGDPAARRERQAALLAAGCVDVIPDVSGLPDWLAARS